MGDFDDATAVRPADDGVTFSTRLDEQWTVGGRPNGGYLLAILARAASRAALAAAHDHPDPLAASATFLRPPSPGPATVVTELLRGGRRASQVRARLVHDGLVSVDAVVTLGRLDPAAEPLWTDTPAVALPPEATCVRLPADRPGVATRVALLDATEVRLDPAVLGFAQGRPGGAAELRGWVRLADGQPPDPFVLLYVLDALPPATFELGSVGWVPTLALTTYVRASPAPGVLRVRQRARLVDGGTVDEVCDVWDRRGRLVGQAVQLALVTFPPD